MSKSLSGRIVSDSKWSHSVLLLYERSDSMQFHGFQRNYRELEKKLKGKRVLIKKGTRLTSMHPQKKGPFEAGRSYRVTIDHIMCGRSVTIGYEYPEDVRSEFSISGVNDSDLYRMFQRFGLSYNHNMSDLEVIEALEATGNVTRVPYFSEAEIAAGKTSGLMKVVVHLEDPEIRWPGTGGYWTDANINDVIAANPELVELLS